MIETLKGKAVGQVTVNQQAGYDENGDFFTIDGDRMLIPGKIYLFATVYDSVHDWYTLVPNAGDVPLTVKEEVSASGDGDIVFDESSQKAIEEMKRGIENEIPFEPGTGSMVSLMRKGVRASFLTPFLFWPVGYFLSSSFIFRYSSSLIS